MIPLSSFQVKKTLISFTISKLKKGGVIKNFSESMHILIFSDNAKKT